MHIQKELSDSGLQQTRFSQNFLLGALVKGIGRPSFESCFFDFFDNLLGISQCIVLAYRKGGKRQVVVARGQNCRNENVKILTSEYGQGIYKEDYHVEEYAQHEPVPDSIWCRGHAATALNGKSSSKLCDEQNLAQNLTLSYREGGRSILAILFRSPALGEFTPEEAELAGGYRDLSISLLNRHLELLKPECPSQVSVDDRNQRVLDLLLQWDLTPREVEICAMKLVGYTSLGISLHLDISTNTVSTHIKRAYSKLGIASQSELFCRCFDALIGEDEIRH
ncbi:MAG: helix-turn-helix transcriptional regulator [Halioglobus sp.]